MKAELKKAWVEALRSGKYRQGRHILHNTATHTFCCLGVLADIVGCAWHDGGCCTHPDYPEMQQSGSFDQIVGEKLGLTEMQQSLLVRQNDLMGLSFAQIADWIDVNIKET